MKHKTTAWFVYRPCDEQIHESESSTEDLARAWWEKINKGLGLLWNPDAAKIGYTVRRVTVEWEE